MMNYFCDCAILFVAAALIRRCHPAICHLFDFAILVVRILSNFIKECFDEFIGVKDCQIGGGFSQPDEFYG